MGISPEAQNTENTIHRSNDAQEEGRRGPWSWKGSMQQCRGLSGQGSRRELTGELWEGKGLMGLSGRGKPGKRKSFEM